MDKELSTRAGLPDDLLALLRAYPRQEWRAHPHFDGLVSFWLDRHGMFRKLCEMLIDDVEAAIDGQLDAQQYRQRLARFGTMMLQQLQGHHQIEDMHYFPALTRLENSLARGFDILDHDHHSLDDVLGRFSESANSVLRGTAQIGIFHGELLKFKSLLLRHLDDEEDLIVPIILRHGSAGLL